MIDKNNYYIGNIQLPNTISMEEQVGLLKDYHYNNNQEAKNKLIVHNTRAVSSMVNKYFGITDLDELFSIGVEGLIKAVDKFDISKYDNKVISYAVWWIRKCILEAIEKKGMLDTENIDDIYKQVNDDDETKVDDENIKVIIPVLVSS